MSARAISILLATTALLSVAVSCSEKDPKPEDGDTGTETGGGGRPDKPGPTASCDQPVVLGFGTLDEFPEEKRCKKTATTPAAAAGQVDRCMAGPAGTIEGGGLAPGFASVALYRAGAQVTFGQSPMGSEPWTVRVPQIDCNRTGPECGALYDTAEYEVVITKDEATQSCAAFGDVKLTIPLHE
jgi:hypothetical protein